MDEFRFRTKSLGVDLYWVQENNIIYVTSTCAAI